jgi:hypothetical protein
MIIQNSFALDQFSRKAAKLRKIAKRNCRKYNLNCFVPRNDICVLSANTLAKGAHKDARSGKEMFLQNRS